MPSKCSCPCRTLEDVYMRHHDPTLRILISRASREDAEDAIQEVCIFILQRERHRKPGRPRVVRCGTLLAIARSRLGAIQRHNACERRHTENAARSRAIATHYVDE